jgi:hypothetical protein
MNYREAEREGFTTLRSAAILAFGLGVRHLRAKPTKTERVVLIGAALYLLFSMVVVTLAR